MELDRCSDKVSLVSMWKLVKCVSCESATVNDFFGMCCELSFFNVQAISSFFVYFVERRDPDCASKVPSSG